MRIEAGQAFAWSEIDQAPEVPGVYAWYSKLVISKADIEAVIKKVTAAQLEGDAQARAAVEAALNTFIFGPYQETPYQVTMRGQLKPKFFGEVVHEPSKSDSLIERLAADPDRFRVIADVLKNVAPWFTAPLYIGMAKNLRSRLKQHRNKIVELRDLHGGGSRDIVAEAGFANQVVARNFDPTNLFVHISEVRVDTGEHNDLENILNRINYPIFGRN
ncbi:GIY-YIG nuclease family protein [Pseudomonas sp. 7P_10.2_Bac1]|uniref:GIY-YIG nuclease family protein n=1 Tax=Pseudomonas sp. 7P_10.2_Bac1 TaxID=2971614 RepID=UPI0021C78D90|nr:GIY-YIG nuclease family protein [Pseudomonas sp. 7P_10.2_Bac1]MCU1727806.1 GIY-YIG nuclease family protein [Pseudomonas sp. 7P_10.2_Bac1]